MGWMGLDPWDEIRWIKTTTDAENSAKAAAAQYPPDMAAWGAHIARTSPWLNAGTFLALVKGTTSMDTVSHVARLAAQDKAISNPSNAAPGDYVRGGQLVPGHRGLFAPVEKRYAQLQAQSEKLRELRPEQGEVRGAILGGRGRPAPGISPLDDMVAQGIANVDGRLIMPAEREWDPPKNRWKYKEGTPEAVAQGKAFDRYVSHLPPDRPVPAIQNGVVGVYYPGSQWFMDEETMAMQGDLHKSAGIPGLVTSGLGALGAPAMEYLQTHRLPVLPGTDSLRANQPQVATGGPDTLANTAQEYFMALNAPQQEFQGQIRNIYGQATGRDVDWWEPQSDIGIQLGTGKSPNVGGNVGLFVNPHSEIAIERRRRELEHGGLVNGQRVTVGRLAAAGAADLGIIEPDTQPYRVLSGLTDASVQFFADPTILGAGRIAKVNEARNLFKAGEETEEATGLIKGVFTGGAHGPTTEGYFMGKEGSALSERIAGISDAAYLDKKTGSVLTRAELKALRDADTPEAVQDVLRPMLGPTFRTTQDVWTMPNVLNPLSRVQGSARDIATRAMMDIPDLAVDPWNDRSLLDFTEQWLRNSHVKSDVIDHFMNKIIDAEPGTPTLDAMEDIMGHSEGVLAIKGVPKAVISDLTSRWRKEMDAARGWSLQEAVDHITSGDEIQVADDVIGTGDPFLWNDVQGHTIPLPDNRAFRRLSSMYPNIAWNAEGQLRVPLKVVQHWQEELWKPFVLLRGAWPVRVIGEEQLRMSAADWASVFKDQLSYVAYAIKRREGLLGDAFEESEQFQRGMSHGVGGWAGDAPGRVRTGRDIVINRNDNPKGFVDAWANMIVRLNRDKTSNMLSNQDNLDEAWDLFRNSEERATFAERRPLMNDDDAARPYLEILSRRLDHYTGGNDELLGAIRTGEFRGEALLNPKTMEISPKLRRALADDLFDAGPAAVAGKQLYKGRNVERSGIVDRMFGVLMSRPTNYLSRSPTFRQAYWKRVEELIPFADPEEKARIIEGARAHFQTELGPLTVGKKTVDRMAGLEAKGRLTAIEVDQYAKAAGLDEVQTLLYDLSKRSQIADSMKLVAPFGEAWKEVVTEWARLANPTSARGVRNLQRFQQLMHAARGRQVGGALGAPLDIDGQQKGFFWKDEYGEEVFVYPGSQWLNQQKWAHVPDWVPGLGGFGTPGIPVPLTGRVMGLSMFGSVLPGIGPAAAIPAAWFLPDKPGWQRLGREWLLPYGSVTDEEGQSALFNVLNFAPPWMRTAFQALLGGGFDTETNRLYANSTMSAANYLYSTGKYDTTSQRGWNELMGDAKKAARNLYLVRGLVAFGAPAAPKADWLVQTNDRAIRLAELRDEYYRFLADPDIGPTKADEEFLKRWGPQAGMTMQAFTRQVQGGIGVTKEFGDWAKKNKKLAVDFPNVYAFFGPQEGDFDYNTYRSQILSGEREALTLDEWRRLGEHHLGQMQIDRASAMMPDNPTDEDRAWYDSVVDWVYQNYPGYNDFREISDRGDRDVVMRELGQAVKDRRVLNTEAGKALQQYWNAREQVVASAHDQGLKTINGKALEPDRQWLFDGGQWLARNYPDFKAIWNRWLRSEVDPSGG